jgi:hypothetical protein
MMCMSLSSTLNPFFAMGAPLLQAIRIWRAGP